MDGQIDILYIVAVAAASAHHDEASDDVTDEVMESELVGLV